MFGDYKSTCQGAETSAGCNSGNNTASSSFERYENSDLILSKLDKMVELSGKCDIKDNPDSEIKVTLTPQGYSAVVLVTGFMPIIGISTAGLSQQKAIAKCENGRWSLAIDACSNGLQAIGVHRVDLTLSGVSSAGRKVVISDGNIAANINRTENCL